MSERGVDIFMSIDAEGIVEASERGERTSPTASYSSTEIFEVRDASVRLSLSADEGVRDDRLILRLSSYHNKDVASGRVFHSHMEVSLTADQVRAIRRFTAFLLRNNIPRPSP